MKRGGKVRSIAEVLGRMTARQPWVSDEELAAYESELAAKQREENIRDSGVRPMLKPGIAKLAVRDDLDSTPALDLVRRWRAYAEQHNTKRTLILFGPRGVGKTVAAAWALTRNRGRYVKSDELGRLWTAHERIQQRGIGELGSRNDEWLEYATTGLLVVDEIGDERDATDARRMLGELADVRQGRRLTLLLGNVSKKVLQERVDMRTWDRWREEAVLVRVEGESLRKGEL